LQIVWFYINLCKYWREGPIFRKIYSVILNFRGKIRRFLTEKSYIGRGAYDLGRLEGRVKTDCVWLATFRGGKTNYVWLGERWVQGSHTLLHVWVQFIMENSEISWRRTQEELKLLFINMHHLINEYRVHQARETLRLMLEVQAHERREIAQRFGAHFETAERTLATCLNQIPPQLCSTLDLDLTTTVVEEQQTQATVVATAAPPSDESGRMEEKEAEQEANREIDDFLCAIVDKE